MCAGCQLFWAWHNAKRWAGLWPPFFGNAMAAPPIFVFQDADSESDIESFEFERSWPHLPFDFLITSGTKKSKFDNFNKNGVILAANYERSSSLVSKFKWNNISSLFVQTTVENWQNPGFDSFLAQKGVKCCSIEMLRPDLKSSRYLQSKWRPLFC